jgi:hypothetical protein
MDTGRAIVERAGRAPVLGEPRVHKAPASSRSRRWLDRTLMAALVIAGLVAGLYGLDLASRPNSYSPGAGKLILAGMASVAIVAIWIWRSRGRIASTAAEASLNAAASSLRIGRRINAKRERIATEIRRRADRPN